MVHLRTDCPHYGSTPETPPAPTVTGELKVGDVAYTRVRIDTDPGEDGWCFMTPENHPDDVARGLVERQWEDSSQFFGKAIPSPNAAPEDHIRSAAEMVPQAEAVVTEADRRAAAAFVRHAWHLFWPNNYVQAMQDAKDMEAGRCDNWFLVQSFARHREAALRQHQSEVERLSKDFDVMSAAWADASERATKAEAENERLRANLASRDEFLVSNGMFSAYTDQLARQARDAQG